ncbi:hypothetical protein C8Q76DRAFT_790703 [Earliella scabrosa]|nr:hypothetical protein C8Q76DRAFT_790703 [Earliella scabrosa]
MSLSTYSSAEVYTCAHSSPDEHEQDPPATKTLSIQALRPRHDSSAEVHTCAHTPRFVFPPRLRAPAFACAHLSSRPSSGYPIPEPPSCALISRRLYADRSPYSSRRTRPLRFTPARTAHPTSMSKTLRPRHDSSAEVYTCAHSSPDEHEQDPPARHDSIQDLRPRHDSSAEVHTCAHTPRSPTFRLPSPTPSTRVCVRPPIISPVLGLPHSRARLLSTYSIQDLRPRHDSSAEVYTCAHTSRARLLSTYSSAEVYTCAHTSRARLLSTYSIQDLRPRHDSSAEVYTCAHTSRARLLSTYSSAEVYTCAHSSPDEHEQDPPATKTLSIQALRPRHDSSAEVYTCAHSSPDEHEQDPPAPPRLVR